MSWIETAHAGLFDFVNPSRSRFTIHDIATALSHICRFTGHTRYHYSVAQHSVLVSRLVPKKLAFEGLMHDAHEAFIGDVSSPLKGLLEDYRRIEALVESEVRGRYELPAQLSPEVRRADLVALATEREALLPHTGVTWAAIADISPMEGMIKPMSPDEAKESFLWEFYRGR